MADLPVYATGVFPAVLQEVLVAHPGDETGRMLRSPGLRSGGKFYAFAAADQLVVKLPRDRVAELIESGDGLVCSPRPGRPMREWVCIPSPDRSASVSLVLEARAFLTRSPAG